LLHILAPASIITGLLSIYLVADSFLFQLPCLLNHLIKTVLSSRKANGMEIVLAIGWGDEFEVFNPV